MLVDLDNENHSLDIFCTTCSLFKSPIMREFMIDSSELSPML